MSDLRCCYDNRPGYTGSCEQDMRFDKEEYFKQYFLSGKHFADSNRNITMDCAQLGKTYNLSPEPNILNNKIRAVRETFKDF